MLMWQSIPCVFIPRGHLTTFQKTLVKFPTMWANEVGKCPAGRGLTEQHLPHSFEKERHFEILIYFFSTAERARWLADCRQVRTLITGI